MRLLEELRVLKSDCSYSHIEEFKKYFDDLRSDSDYKRYMSYFNLFMESIGNYSYDEITGITDDLTRIECDFCYLFSKYQNALWECSCTNVPYIQSFFYEIGDYVQMELDEYITRIKAIQETKKEEEK